MSCVSMVCRHHLFVTSAYFVMLVACELSSAFCAFAEHLKVKACPTCNAGYFFHCTRAKRRPSQTPSDIFEDEDYDDGFAVDASLVSSELK